ncbi:MAG: hypothetical protein LBI14_09320 [Treponema sp.]|jgi:hypothetical protein|nr:hypothetical protein [Treponema sp.]
MRDRINEKLLQKQVGHKTDANCKYNFCAFVVPLYFETILLSIRDDLVNILADRDLDTYLAKSKYLSM